ncbi:MAG: hypothetical protein J7M21_02420, partial [Planctomycetes bacterium]|nr:hypothetical protein [Planctomycetota bacterium]
NNGTDSEDGTSSVVFDHANITDEAGKIGYGGGSSLTFRDTVMARSIMGPEVWPDHLLLEDTWITDMHNFDDADGIYVHNTAPGAAMMTGGVMAVFDDDAVDTLNADLTVEDYVIRDAFDKGVSVYGGEVTVNWTVLVNNGTDSEDGTSSTISAKTFANDTVTVNMDHDTIVTTKQDGVTDVGIEARWKFANAYPVTITYNVSNCIIDATRPAQNDYDDPTKANYFPDSGSTVTFNTSYTNLFGPETGWGRAGTGNINADPLFTDAAGHDYHLQPTSPSIDAGDPSFVLDEDGSTTDQGRYTNNEKQPYVPPTGSLTEDTVWSPQDGQYRISGELTVPDGVTLTIMPGTTVFFESAGKLIVNGTLTAGADDGPPVRFVHYPGTSTWSGIRFIDSMNGSAIRNAILEYVDDDDGIISLVNSELTLAGSTLDHAHRRRITAVDSSLTVRDCTFADLFETPPASVPDNVSEHIWGQGIAAGGQVFIEGNTFLHYHKDQFNTDPGESNAISAGSGHDYIVVDNVFYDADHVAIVKESSFMTFVNNTVASVEAPASSPQAGAIYFDLAGQTGGPGDGAYVEASIFHDTPEIFSAVVPGVTNLTVNYSMVNADDVALGSGNFTGDPRFVDPGGDWHLGAGSPATAAGPFGMDLGAYVPRGANIGGGPYRRTYSTDAVFDVGGNAVTA